jgi:hypothetical protein
MFGKVRIIGKDLADPTKFGLNIQRNAGNVR